ncbi:MAG: DUF362 domain-containing protein [Candidatus Thorarchaeota archaeon]
MSYVSVAIKRTPKEALSTALSKLPVPLSISPDVKRIVLKPSIYDPELPGNTSFDMMSAVVDFFKQVSPISIVESDNPVRTAEEAYSKCGYKAFLEQGVELVNLSSATGGIPFGGILENELVPPILGANRYLINVAALKHSDSTHIGAGIKNLFGLISRRDKDQYHSRLADVLVLLLQKLPPVLSIVDLTRYVVGDRRNAQVHEVGGVVIGTDALAVDSYCCELLDIDPLEVDYIQKAYRLGLGEALLERIRVLGTEHQIEKLKTIFRNIPVRK